VEPASLFGLIRGLFEAIRNVFGVVAPKLELTYEAGRSPYVEADDYLITLLGRPEQAPGDPDPSGFAPLPNDVLLSTSTTGSSRRRWFRVGIKNRSLVTVEGVRIELASIDPPVIGHLPLPLSIMHHTPQPLTINRASEPTVFADVILKVDADDRMHGRSEPQASRLTHRCTCVVTETVRKQNLVFELVLADFWNQHQHRSSVDCGPKGHARRSRSWSQDRFRSRRGDSLGSFIFDEDPSPSVWASQQGRDSSARSRILEHADGRGVWCQ
jgi:hypothetical protein